MTDKLRQFRLATARRLRANTTNAERRLWFELRKLPLYGTHFRRQVVVGPYVADFACMRPKLIIEVDGGQYTQSANIVRDAARTRWLESEGYKILRFWNSDVTQNIDGVIERVYAELSACPHTEPEAIDHPTPARTHGARRPSPSRGG